MARKHSNVKSIGQLINADENCHRQMAHFEKDILVSAYQECVGNISKLAQRLGLDRSTFSIALLYSQTIQNSPCTGSTKRALVR